MTHTTSPFFTLLQGADILFPEGKRTCDILIAGEKIAAIAPRLEPPAGYDCAVIDLHGLLVAPGFIDSHVHLIGGGGEGGFATRTPETTLSKITSCGVTTVVGCLGTDGTTRHVASLLAKARGLEAEGISAYLYTGAYEIPTPTVTGSVRGDIVLIDKIIGAGEIALSDHRSAQPRREEYQKLAAEARVGGMLSGKAGIVDTHLGDGQSGLKYLFEIAASGEIPRAQFLPTHINRNERLFEEGIVWAKQGGYIDITSGIGPDDGCKNAVKPSRAVRRALDAGVALDRIAMSSDGNGSMPVFDAAGNTVGIAVASQASLLAVVRAMICEEKIPAEDAVQTVTVNVARALKLHPQKGCIAVGCDADLTVLDGEFALRHVWARGRQMVKDSKPIVFGTFEERI